MVGKVQKQFHLLCGALLMFGLLHMCTADGANFLGMYQRFNDSNSYDSYYCCNSCGALLSWVFDEDEVVVHRTSQSQVGSTVYELHGANNNRQHYYSMVLSKRPVGSETCMDVVLTVTQTRRDWRPVVVCQIDGQDFPVRGGDRMEIIDPEDKVSSSITVNHPIVNKPDVVDPGNNCLTQILVCRINDNLLRWFDENINTLFNENSGPGFNAYQTHPNDSTIALYNAVVLNTMENDIVSVIAWTDYESVGRYNITCQSRTDQVSIMVKARLSSESTMSSENTMSSEATTFDLTTTATTLDLTTATTFDSTTTAAVDMSLAPNLSVVLVLVSAMVSTVFS